MGAAELREDEILHFMSELKPVMATWVTNGVREPVFIAHELQAILPSAVTGHKDSADYQTVDYAKVVPVLVAAIQYLLKKG